MHYPPSVEIKILASCVTYAIEVLNPDGPRRGTFESGAGVAGPTLPPPRDFAAQVTGQGVVLSLDAEMFHRPIRRHYLYRVYRTRRKAAAQRDARPAR